MDSDAVATLDAPLDTVSEAKFNALKKLQALKVKSLMGSIDALQKKNAELKLNGKDIRRTQMIQSLKNKLKNQELITDYLKVELVQPSQDAKSEFKEDDTRKFLSITDVNNYIMKKTLGGPKRFRPLTREEMENKILDGDKTIEKMTKKISELDIDLKRFQNSSALESKVSEPKVQRKASQPENKAEAKGGPGDSVKILQLTDQINSLKATLEVKSLMLQEAKEESARLRSKNSDLKALEENMTCSDKLYEEVQELYRRISEELDDTVTALALSREEAIQIRAETDAELEGQKMELDLVNNSYEILLRQNASLLSKVQEAEGVSPLHADDKFKTAPLPSQNYEAKSQTVSAKDNRVYEQKVLSLRTKLAESVSRCRELEEEPKKSALLIEDLRSKNELIRDLKRNIAEMSKKEYPSRDLSPARPTANDELVGNLYDEIRRLKSEILRQKSLVKQPAVSRDSSAFGTPTLMKFVGHIIESFTLVLTETVDHVDLKLSVLDDLELLKSDMEDVMKLDDEAISRDKLSALYEIIDMVERSHETNGSPFSKLAPGGSYS